MSIIQEFCGVTLGNVYSYEKLEGVTEPLPH